MSGSESISEHRKRDWLHQQPAAKYVICHNIHIKMYMYKQWRISTKTKTIQTTFNSINKRIKNMTTSVETVIKLACTNLAGTLFFCIQYSGGGMKWNINKKMTKKIEVVGVQPPTPPPYPFKKRCYVPELFD